MILQEAIEKRRSVRKYTNTAVEKEKIEHLILNASKAPSAMNLQPWAFAVIENTELLDRYSTEIKKSLIEKMNTEKLTLFFIGKIEYTITVLNSESITTNHILCR